MPFLIKHKSKVRCQACEEKENLSDFWRTRDREISDRKVEVSHILRRNH